MIRWTKEKVKRKLIEINANGFIGIPDVMFRKDDGVVGQVLERQFGINENNINMGDLGEFELKGVCKINCVTS